jgi:hypothetical protein
MLSCSKSRIELHIYIMSHEHVEGTIRKVLVATSLGVHSVLLIAALWPFNPFQLINGMEVAAALWGF